MNSSCVECMMINNTTCLSESRKLAIETKDNLEECRQLLQCKRFDLLHLWLKSIQYKEVTRLLDVVYVSFVKGIILAD
jgi:hypothetical protein